MILELARDVLHKSGNYNVVAGIMSPTHDGYGKKVGLSVSILIEEILELTFSVDVFVWITFPPKKTTLHRPDIPRLCIESCIFSYFSRALFSSILLCLRHFLDSIKHLLVFATLNSGENPLDREVWWNHANQPQVYSNNKCGELFFHCSFVLFTSQTSTTCCTERRQRVRGSLYRNIWSLSQCCAYHFILCLTIFLTRFLFWVSVYDNDVHTSLCSLTHLILIQFNFYIVGFDQFKTQAENVWIGAENVWLDHVSTIPSSL